MVTLVAASILIRAALGAGMGVARAGVTHADVYCPPQMRTFVNALTNIDGRLDVGMTFTQYKNAIGAALIAYHRIPVSAESQSCVRYVGAPAERALNAYVKALNSWKQCIAKVIGGQLADCNGGPGEIFRQAQWQNAGANVRRAVEALGA